MKRIVAESHCKAFKERNCVRGAIVPWFWIWGILLTTPLRSADLASLSVAPPAEGCVRVATFNVSLHRKAEGELLRDLQTGDPQIERIAKIVQLVRPDILLVNELDYDPDHKALDLLAERYFQVSQSGLPALDYPHRFAAPVNTGVPSGMDLNRNGRDGDPEDRWGFGAYPGQYGMGIFSRFPIARDSVRTFQLLKWSDMPGAKQPFDPERSQAYWPEEVWRRLRLSSKSHWDVPIQIQGRKLHFLASHPTPPVFDGKEDRNGCRNHDELRLLHDYIMGGTDAQYIRDDAGKVGGLSASDSFVVGGDLNSDPNDGDGQSRAIRQLLSCTRMAQVPAPKSDGAVQASRVQGKANLQHRGPAGEDTADFSDRVSGNLRCDFLLPSSDVTVAASGVFWPTPTDLQNTDPALLGASDHRLVWIDIRW